MKLISWNVNGIRACIGKGFEESFAALDADIFCLQETKCQQGQVKLEREFDSWISEKSTCRSHKTCFFCVKFLVFIYCILLQCVVKYNKGGILHASYYIEI